MEPSEIIDGILEAEGSDYTNNPADPGGPTRYGITQETLAAWRLKDVTPADVEALTEAEAREIYLQRYYLGPGFNKVPGGILRALLTDCCVLHGQGNAVRFLQRALKVKDDGALGPKTLEAALKIEDLGQLYRNVLAERAEFFGRHIHGNLTDADKDGIPDVNEFAKGWLKNRLADWIRLAV